MPYTRIFAAFMLATLISTLFALPAYAAANQIDFNVTGSAPKVAENAPYSYTVTLTNNSGVLADTLSFVDTVTGGGTLTSAVPSGGVGGACTAPALNATTCTFTNLAILGVATVTVNVTAPALPGTVTNTVSAFSDTQGDAANPVSPSASTVVENADLVVTKTHTGVTTPGGALTYTITVHNNGPDPAAGVTLHDAAPAGITFGTVTVVSNPVLGGPAACSAAAANLIDCVGWAIPVNTTVTVTVLATLSAAAAVGSTVANTASITPPATTFDSNLLNNTVTDQFVVGAPDVDLGVTLTVLPTTASPGDTVTYTATVSNPNATTDATNVVVTDVLPAGLTAVSPPTTPAVGNGTVALANNTWTWTIPTVAKASAPATPTTVTASFDATVDPSTSLPTISNTVTMTATQNDPTPANNTATADLTISAEQADLNIATAVDDSKPNKGDTIHITIQVSNAGPADATNIVVKDVLPTGLKYVSCTSCTGGLRRQSSLPFTLASLSANSAASVTLNVLVQASSGTVQNTASVVSFDQTDPTSANNNDSLSITIGGSANNPGGPTGSTGGTGGTGGTTGGTTAFTGFTAGQLMPWFMLLFSLGLVAVEWSRRMRLVSPIGSTYGFEPPF